MDAHTQRTMLVQVALPVPLRETYTYRWRGGGEQDEREPAAGDLVVVPFGRRKRVVALVVGVTEAAAEVNTISGHRLRDLERLLPREYSLGENRQALATWLAEYLGVALGEVVPLFHPPHPGTRARKSRHREVPYPRVDADVVQLTAAQQRAVDEAVGQLDADRFGALLLHGVTGSGKTEVFLRVLEASIARGRGAIYLLPEIALTPQTLGRITARFGDRAAALHSGLSAGERCRVHEAAARGEIQVVVGPRSALFAPVRDLGVIVVDEEHETSYKQEEKPRYHARNTALMRGRLSRAVVMLGSATPDLESYRNASSGRFSLVTLAERQGASLPSVQIVDLRGIGTQDGLSAPLLEAIGDTLDSRRQVILYYNRRGFARAQQCRECGESEGCPHCDIGLTYHLRPARLLCHYCGYQKPVATVCGNCQGSEFLPTGGGTERVELALQAHFPEARVLRLDQDTTRRRGSHGRILAAFANEQAEILVGTQMVAKGHHFPAVQLVGVLAADDGLSLPDFRAAERSFQLLTQVAGRSGRTGPGRVLFQAYRPEDPVVLAAADHDYGSFVTAEMAARRDLGYPPFRRLLRIGLSGRRRGETEAAAADLATVVRENLNREDRDILGPAPAVFSRLQDRYRFQILVKGTLAVREKEWLAGCLRSLQQSWRGVDAYLDVDPLGLF